MATVTDRRTAKIEGHFWRLLGAISYLFLTFDLGLVALRLTVAWLVVSAPQRECSWPVPAPWLPWPAPASALPSGSRFGHPTAPEPTA
jgi:hypothetical protein